jgi:hypothetical protein
LCSYSIKDSEDEKMKVIVAKLEGRRPIGRWENLHA